MNTPIKSLNYRILTTILPLALLTIIAFSMYNYFSFKQKILADFTATQKQAETEIVNSLMLMDAGYRMLENRLESEMQQYFPMLLSAYKEAGNNPAAMNLLSLKEAMQKNLDIYIIDADAIIRWSTDSKGLGFDFKAFEMGDRLRDVRMGNTMVRERVRTNILNGQLGDWVYMPTPDHRYIIEIGYGSSTELGKIAGDLDPMKVAKQLEKNSEYVDEVKIYDVYGYEFGHSGAKDYKPNSALKEQIAQVIKQGRVVVDHQTRPVIYHYVNLAPLKKSISNPNKILRIQFNKEPVLHYLTSKVHSNIIIVLLFLLSLSAIIILLSRRLTQPLKQLTTTAMLVAHGDLSKRVQISSGNDEISALAVVFNQMLENLSSHESQLEGIVQQRTLELHEQSQALQDAINVKYKIFAIIAHDLKGPISNMASAFDLIQQGELDLDQDMIDGFTKSANNTNNLLNELLSWSLSQQEKLTMNPSTFSLLTPTQAAIQLLMHSAQQKDINIINDIIPEAYVSADFSMVSTAIRNLLNNALKFSHRGGEVILSCSEENNMWCFEVHDNGVGIEPNILANIFTLGKDLAYSLGTQNELGSGLGLLLVKEFIEKSNGKVGVRSEPNVGSTFYFTLPKASISQ